MKRTIFTILICITLSLVCSMIRSSKAQDYTGYCDLGLPNEGTPTPTPNPTPDCFTVTHFDVVSVDTCDCYYLVTECYCDGQLVGYDYHLDHITCYCQNGDC